MRLEHQSRDKARDFADRRGVANLTKHTLEEIKSLSDKEARKVSAFLHILNGINLEELFKDLVSNPDFSVARNFPPCFWKVEPAIGKGIPASQLLTQDRG